MELKVLYEDNHLIVVVKPRGYLSQEDATKDRDMLTEIKKYLKNKYNKPGNVFLGLVHRLDRMTSGVMVFAKTSKGASRLSEAIRLNKFHKKYYAIVEGHTDSFQELTNYLIKDKEEVKSYVSSNEKVGKIASLQYELIKYMNGFSLINVLLITGRHHQIRVQMANINHPLAGDKLYGAKSSDGIYLHCYEISFPHPITKEQLSFSYLPSGGKWDEFIT